MIRGSEILSLLRGEGLPELVFRGPFFFCRVSPVYAAVTLSALGGVQRELSPRC